MTRSGASFAALVLAVSLLTAGPADAATAVVDNVTYVTKAKMFDGTARSGKVTATCPDGTHATGAAAQAGNTATISAATLIDGADDDSDPDDAAVAAARWPRRKKDVKVKATVVCVDDEGVGYNRATQEIVPEDTEAIGTGCPAGSWDFLGGGGGFPDRSGELVETYPDWEDDVWRVIAQNVTATARTLESVTVCFPAGVRSIQLASAPEVIIDPGETATVHAECPSDMHAVSGGVDTTGGRVRSTAPVDGADDDRALDEGWTSVVTAGEFATGATPYAICMGGVF